MNSVSFHEPTIPIQIGDLRNAPRIETSDLLTVLKWGTGQVIDISSTGLAFGCLYPHILPEQWRMDILDAQGLHLKNVLVRKIWETALDYTEPSSVFEVVTGVEFIHLTPEQSFEIKKLVERLEYSALNRMFEELELSGFKNPSIIK